MINHKFFAVVVLLIVGISLSCYSQTDSKNPLVQYKPGKSTFVKKTITASSVPVITPKNNLNFSLNGNGQLTIQPDDIVTVTNYTEISLDRTTFDCSTLGDQIINVTAKGIPTQPTAVKFNLPYGLGFDAAGNLYIADLGNARIREIAVNGVVTTFAGTGVSGNNDGPRMQATFAAPTLLAVGPDGSIYVADEGIGDIRKISNGTVTTILQHYFVSGLTVDKNNVLYASTSNSIVKIGDDGSITNFVTELGQPFGLTFGNDGNLYVADPGFSSIQKITPQGNLSTIVQNFPYTSYVSYLNGNPVGNYPSIVIDSQGNFFIAIGYVVWKVKPDGSYALFAGTVNGFKDGQGVNAKFSGTWGIAVDKNDNLYVTDYEYSYTANSGNNAIREITPTGYVSTIAGGIAGFSNGTIGGNETVTLPVHVNIMTQPSIEKLQDVTLSANANCQAALPDYTSQAIVSDPCSNIKLNVTQSPVAGTLINSGIPTVVTITTADGYGGQSSTSFTATVKPVIVPSLKIQSNLSNVCSGMPITFTATPTNGGSNPQYQWELDGNPVGTNSQTFTISNLKPSDLISCVLTNNDQCVVSHSAVSNMLSIMVYNNTPAASSINIIPSEVQPVCLGTGINFTAQVTNPVDNINYQWQVNNVNEGEDSPSFSSNSLNNGDIVSCVLTGNGNCITQVSSAPMVVQISPQPVIKFDKNVSINIGDKIELNPVITGDIKSYSWNPIIGLSNPDIENPIAKPNITTTYYLTVTNAYGCSIVGAVTINVIPNISIPNTFTPNGDGINDTWVITGLSNKSGTSVKVYNRYGTLLFQSNGYTIAWDGRYKGKKLPSGTYYYIIKNGSDKQNLSGSITIVY